MSVLLEPVWSQKFPLADRDFLGYSNMSPLWLHRGPWRLRSVQLEGAGTNGVKKKQRHALAIQNFPRLNLDEQMPIGIVSFKA